MKQNARRDKPLTFNAHVNERLEKFKWKNQKYPVTGPLPESLLRIPLPSVHEIHQAVP